MNIQETIRAILRDPVTLQAIDPADYSEDGFLALRAGGISRKNEEEIAHFRRSFNPNLTPEEKSYARKISTLPKPETSPESVILDIGCGPYDCISAIPGVHIFLDDIMDLYVGEIGAKLNGARICARTELMPLADESIDLLYSVNMIDHVDDMPATLAEMHRVMKPGGRVLMQTYFNSHPLLDTEPGVFDGHFATHYVAPLFDVLMFDSYAVGDPAISTSYTMDIAALSLTKRTDVPSPVVDRHRYEDPSYLGPQSRISVALGHLKNGDVEAATPHIEALLDHPNYAVQHQLLAAFSDIEQRSFATASRTLQGLLGEDRVRRNSFARIAVQELHLRRMNVANQILRARLAAAQD